MWFFSLSSEVLKLLLKLLLKKGFSELSMDKKYIPSLVKYFNVLSSKSQRGQKLGELPLCQISMELLLGHVGVAVVSQSPPDRQGQLLIKEKPKKKRLLNFQSGGRKGS